MGGAWTDETLTNPHAVADKRQRVQRMFSAIAGSYDLNNRLHSFWRDQAWRRAAVKLAEVKPDDYVVDVACGTGDLTLAFMAELTRIGNVSALADHVIGIDFTFQMLPFAQQKWSQHPLQTEHRGEAFVPQNLRQIVRFLNGDAQQLPLPNACCDVVSIAFGIRNVQNVDAALAEFFRVLRPGGRVVVLEFSEPTNPVLRFVNRLYCGRIMPYTATWISGDRSGAYKYLPKSVETFMSRQQMQNHLETAGFGKIVQKPMTFGVCVAYRGVKVERPVPSPGNPGEG